MGRVATSGAIPGAGAAPEIIIDAYWQSALLFEAIGDSTAARNTLRELLSDERLEDYDAYQLATAKLPELEAIVQAQNELAIQTAKEERAAREH